MSVSRLYSLARRRSEYWEAFVGAEYRFVLAEYPVPQMSKLRNRYSIFAFRREEPVPRACYSWEPHDPEPGTLEAVLGGFPPSEGRDLSEEQVRALDEAGVDLPTTFFGSEDGRIRRNLGQAPPDMTIAEFRPLAIEWAATYVAMADTGLT